MYKEYIFAINNNKRPFPSNQRKMVPMKGAERILYYCSLLSSATNKLPCCSREIAGLSTLVAPSPSGVSLFDSKVR